MTVSKDKYKHLHKHVHLCAMYSHFTGIEYLFTLHGINEKISRFKRTYYACLLHV